MTEPLVAAFRAMVRIQEEFSRAKAAARAERRAAAAARSQPGGGPTGAAPIVDDRSVRRWYGYYLSVVLPGRVEYKLEVRGRSRARACHHGTCLCLSLGRDMHVLHAGRAVLRVREGSSAGESRHFGRTATCVACVLHLTAVRCAFVQEAKRRNVGRVRGQRYSALPLHKMTPEHPVLVSNAEDSDHPAVPSSHHE